eukprot:TRINITY_DN85_c1_g1_i1.p1 TRINITY_DN85_c1_g1~~TRINITY_DN85_c1_g1_i1.p1  ORF type:complete len:311 (+),score=74.57 TRINITY_DN85_c1_g1_i1:94-1026(+)
MLGVCSLPLSGANSATMRLLSRPYSSKPKLDPTKFENNFAKIDTESITYFRNMEAKVEEAYNNVPQKYHRKQEEIFWQNKADDTADMVERERVNPWALPEEKEKPYDPLDLDDETDFAKAMAYVSNEEALNPIANSDIKDVRVRYTIREVLHVARHTQVTTAGRIFSFSALVLVGTGKGTAGLGYGRGNTVAQAIVMAKKKAQKGLMTIDMHRGNTIGRDIRQKYKRSYAWLKARRSGHGTQASRQMKLLLDCFGIKDVTVGKGGSKNRYTVYRAVFKGLRDQVRTQDQVARRLGRKLFNRSKAYYYQNE